jgi:hypothetical protein
VDPGVEFAVRSVSLKQVGEVIRSPDPRAGLTVRFGRAVDNHSTRVCDGGSTAVVTGAAREGRPRWIEREHCEGFSGQVDS